MSGFLPSDEQATMRTYVSGFVLSVALTLTAYLCVTHNALPHRELIVALAGLALAQFMAQLYFFLHLGKETKPRWKLLVFFFMIMVVCILVIGSLWIMANLSRRMMPTPAQINSYMNDQDGL